MLLHITNVGPVQTDCTHLCKETSDDQLRIYKEPNLLLDTAIAQHSAADELIGKVHLESPYVVSRKIVYAVLVMVLLQNDCYSGTKPGLQLVYLSCSKPCV